MRSTRWITALLLPGLLLTVAPDPVPGQEIELALRADAMSDTRVPIERLGEFLARNLMVGVHDARRAIGETEKNLVRGTAETGRSVALRLDLISRKGGTLTVFDSKTVRLEPGTRYPASEWIPHPAAIGDVFAPLKPAEFVIFRIGQKTIAGTRTMPRECGDATHALLVTPRYADDSAAGEALALCFDAGAE